jgi:hypothetical protein
LFVFAEKWSHWGPEDCAKPPPAEAAQLTLQVLYKLVQTFSKQQVSIKEKTPVRMASSQRQAASQEAASLEQAAEATRALIGTLVALDMLLCSRPAHGSQPMSTAYNKQKAEATQTFTMVFKQFFGFTVGNSFNSLIRASSKDWN